ncbi:MAG: lysophospholipid acyltransferase family protein [Kiritimatiellales bacterium]|jgi:putative hemolysin
MNKKSVFSIEPPFKDPVRSAFFNLAQGALENFLYLDQINQIYNRAVEAGKTEGDFLSNVLKATGVSYEVSGADLANIPATGPVVVVANHPFGGIEGIILLHLLRRIRPDVKVMANYVLGRMPEMAEHSIYVDPFGSQEATRRNLAGVKETVRWIRDGHMLAVFPSGEVSHIDLHKRAICDPAWSPTIARIIQKTQAAVLPVFFQGRNGTLFQVMGLIHPRIRTAMLPYEFIRRRNSVFNVNAGQLIPWRRLETFDAGALNNYIRFRTYLLCNRQRRGKKNRPTLFIRKPAQHQPVTSAAGQEALEAEIASRPAEQIMIENDEYIVYLAPAAQIPNLLHEIGRLREITFRAAGEGTGRPIDIDRFDPYYLHLFLWNKPKRELAGAYRLARTDEVIRQHGLNGLYTSTLFHYRAGLLEKLGPSIELGRSFIRPEYQKSYSPLLLLWKGLAQVICRNPGYKSLFGPVSINNDYHSASRQLMATFLKINNFLPELAALVKARNAFRFSPIKNFDPDTFSQTVTDVDDISALIADIETEQKGIPVLLKQYLKLGGKLLGFNIDPNFSDVLDGLIWVDLSETSPKILERFMGKDGTRIFLQFHKRQENE